MDPKTIVGTDAIARVNYFHKRGSKGQLHNSCNTPIAVFDVRDNDLGSAEFVLELRHKNLLTCYCFDDDRERERLSKCNTKSGEKPAKNGDGEKLTGDKKSANKGEKSANDEPKPAKNEGKSAKNISANNAEKATINEPSKEYTKWSRPFRVRGLYRKYDQTIKDHLRTFMPIQREYAVPCNGALRRYRHEHAYVVEPVRILIREMVTFLLDLHMGKQSLLHFSFRNNVVVVGGTAMFVNLLKTEEPTVESMKANMSAFLTELRAYFPSDASKATKKPQGQPVLKEVPFDMEHFLKLLSRYDGRPEPVYHILSKHLSLLSSTDRLRAIENYTRNEAFLSSNEKTLYRNAKMALRVSENVDWPGMFADKNHAYGEYGVFGAIWQCYNKHQNIRQQASQDNSIKARMNQPQDDLIRFCRHLTVHLPEGLYHHYTPSEKASAGCLTEEAVDLTIMAGFGKELLSFQYQLHVAQLLSKFV